MREKFKAPEAPSENEQLFIEYMEKTHDQYGLSEHTLALFLNVSQRKLRTYKERYNNLKYIGIIPQGKIRNINGLYKLVRFDSKFAHKTILKARYDKICAIIDEYNTRRILGDIQHVGQQVLYAGMSYNELLKHANELDEELKENNFL